MSTVSKTYSTKPSGYDSTYSSYASASNISNGYALSDSTTYATITCTTGSNAISYISYTFDWSNIPSNATITGVYGWVKLRVSNTTSLPSTALAFYSGSTRKSSSKNFSSSSTYNTVEFTTSDCGTWTRAELDTMELRATAQRGTSNTSSAAYIYFYGATIVVDYTYEKYSFTVTNTSPAVIEYSDNGSSGLDYGETYRMNIVISDLTGVTMLDNNVNVTSNIQPGYDTHEYIYTVSNVSSDHIISISGGTASTQYSVTCVNNSSETYNIFIQPSYTFEGDSVFVYLVGESLDNVVIKDNGTDITDQFVSGEDSISFYYYSIVNLNGNHALIISDASESPSTIIWVKQNGTWKQVSNVYTKQNGSWSEVDVKIKTNGGWN